MAEINDWNVAAASNNSAPPDGAPEGMLASAVNNVIRENMAVVARWEKDTNASITPGGTADVITIAANQTLSAYYDGLEIAFQAGADNTGAVTINVDGIGAKNLYKQVSVAMAAGEIATGQKVIAIYDGTNFQLMSAYLDASTAADAVATAADVVTTNADVVLTNADVVTTNADVVLTNADVVLTGNDVTATNADVVSTGNDVTATNADVVLTNADVVTTTTLAKTYSLSYTFSTTTAMADPGSGILRFNNATPASVTAIAIDDLDSDAADQSAYIISWDDSTSTNKGTLNVRQGDTFSTFNITGLTDNVGWTELAVTYVTGSGAFADATATYPGFTRTGDQGSGDLTSTNNLSDVADAPTSFANIKQAASTTATGVVEIATQAEVNTGTDATRSITPETLDAFVNGKTDTVITAADEIVFADATDSNASKKDTVQGILDLVPAGGGAFESALLHVRDEKATATAGGSSSATTWHTRVLNTSKTNEISGASLGSNQITLPAGTYYINAAGPAYKSDGTKCALYNTTDASYEVVGESSNAVSTYNAFDRSRVYGRFTIAAEKVFELRQYISNAQATNGLGQSSSSGQVEVYSEVQIWKVG